MLDPYPTVLPPQVQYPPRTKSGSCCDRKSNLLSTFVFDRLLRFEPLRKCERRYTRPSRTQRHSTGAFGLLCLYPCSSILIEYHNMHHFALVTSSTHNNPINHRSSILSTCSIQIIHRNTCTFASSLAFRYTLRPPHCHLDNEFVAAYSQLESAGQARFRLRIRVYP